MVNAACDLTASRNRGNVGGGFRSGRDRSLKFLHAQHLEVHPRPGKAPGTYNLSAYNPAIRSNMIPGPLPRG